MENLADSLKEGDDKALYAASALQVSMQYFYIARMQHYRAEVRDWGRGEVEGGGREVSVRDESYKRLSKICNEHPCHLASDKSPSLPPHLPPQYAFAFKSFFDGNRYHRAGWSPDSGWHFRDHSVTQEGWAGWRWCCWRQGCSDCVSPMLVVVL